MNNLLATLALTFALASNSFANKEKNYLACEGSGDEITVYTYGKKFIMAPDEYGTYRFHIGENGEIEKFEDGFTYDDSGNLVMPKQKSASEQEREQRQAEEIYTNLVKSETSQAALKKCGERHERKKQHKK